MSCIVGTCLRCVSASMPQPCKIQSPMKNTNNVSTNTAPTTGAKRRTVRDTCQHNIHEGLLLNCVVGWQSHPSDSRTTLTFAAIVLARAAGMPVIGCQQALDPSMPAPHQGLMSGPSLGPACYASRRTTHKAFKQEPLRAKPNNCIHKC
jgi:hypothetical protein